MCPHIHVVSFQNPYPPDYGGVIDVYYKLKALHDTGWRVTFHTYAYKGRDDISPLRQFADKVIVYERMRGLKSQLSRRPYIVNSRRDPRLLKDLCADNDPILFEGLHTCCLLDHPELKNRLKIVRAHNIEHDYYKGLAGNAGSLAKKLFFRLEAGRLKRFERILGHADIIAAVSPGDAAHFSELFPDKKVLLMPCFFDENRDVEGAGAKLPGAGRFVLYHGNLSVEENIGAVKYIADEIAPALPDEKFVAAGLNPSPELVAYCAHSPNVEIITSPSPEEMNRLMSEARVTLLLTFQPTGLKLKLLNAISRSAHIVGNRAMITGSGLENCVTIADTPEEITAAISRLLDTPFTGRAVMPPEYCSNYKISLLEKAIHSLLKIY